MNDFKPLKALLFDFDGTLIDASNVICTCFNRTLARQGLGPLDPEEIRSRIGKPLRDMFLPFSDEADLEQLIRGYRESFHELSPGKSSLIPGVRELLTRMDNGILLGVVTSRTARGARQILEEFQLLEKFTVLIGIEDVTRGKPHPEGLLKALSRMNVSSDRAAFIGDTVFDIEAGRKAGTFTIGVTTGYHTREELIDAGADRVIEHLNELRNLGLW